MEVSQAREAPTDPSLAGAERLPSHTHSPCACAKAWNGLCGLSRGDEFLSGETGRLHSLSDVLVSKQSYDRQRARRVQEHLAECGGYGVQVRRRRIRCKPCGQERQRSQLFLKQGVSLSWHPLGSLLRCLAGRARLEGRQLPQVVEI
eukprot:7382175-Prymnesium_polylepis.2